MEAELAGIRTKLDATSRNLLLWPVSPPCVIFLDVIGSIMRFLDTLGYFKAFFI